MSFWNGSEWVADTPPTTAAAKPEGRVKHVAKAVLEAGLITALTFGLIAGSAFAAKGGGNSANSSVYTFAPQLVWDGNGNASENWDDIITFDVSTSATDKPWVRLDCYQDGVWVSTSTAGFFPAYPWAPNFTLASGAWTSGAASCTATLYKVTSNGRARTLATLTVPVAA